MKKILASVFVVLFCLMGCDSGASNARTVSISADGGITLSDNFSVKNEFWHDYAGEWIFKDGVLRQAGTKEYFPLILRKDREFRDLDISVDFKPISGRIDASGGVVFRAKDGANYYIVRANSLEGNFRLYTFKNGDRRQIASARVTAPALGQYHQIRVVAKGDHIQAYLDKVLLLDHHDTAFTKGYVGLWTKADSVTEFDNLEVSGSR
jgi:hypothetical protein